MKTRVYAFLLAALAIVSCVKETPIQENVNPAESNGVTIRFNAATPTKTTLADAAVSGKKAVSWEAGDEIAIWYLDSGNNPKSITAQADAAGESATFTVQLPAGDNPDHFWAAYPASAGELTYDSAEKFTITVRRTDGSFKAANIMAAYSTAAAKSFAFKNAVAIIALDLPSGGVISHGGKDYTIKTVRLKGKETSIHSFGTVEVTQTGGVVTSFAESTGTSNVTVDVNDAVRTLGVAYLPSFPGELTNGFAIRYTSNDGIIPAVVTNDVVYPVERGHIQPIPNPSSGIVWDYYVAADGSGNGLSASTPMSITDLQTKLAEAKDYIFKASLLSGATIHFAAGTYVLTAPLNFPAYTESASIVLEGNGAVLDGNASSRVIEVIGKGKQLHFKDFIIRNGSAATGAGIFVDPGNAASVKDPIIDFENCNISGNKATTAGAGLHIEKNSTGGQVRFNNCRFENNEVSSGQAGAVYVAVNCDAAVMFNKCSFMGNKATSNTYTIGVNVNSSKDNYHGMLAMNNCTVNTGNKTFSSNGSAITVKGYSIIANSTIWGSGEMGKWGTIALGANKAVQELDANAARIVNCLIRNNSATYKALYLHGSYYQNIDYCLYTGLTETNSPVYTLEHSASIDSAVGGASAKTKAINGITAYYYTFTQDFSSDMTFPTLAQVRDDIAATTKIGPMFLEWLDTIEGSLTTDLIGQERPAGASHPGAWQKQ